MHEHNGCSGVVVCPEYAEWVSRVVLQISLRGTVAAVADSGLNS